MCKPVPGSYNQSAFKWGKRWWGLGMASAWVGPHAKNLHLAPDRLPHQHLLTQFLQVGCSSWRSAHSVIALMAIYYQDLIPYNLIPCSLYLCFWIALHCIALLCVVLLTAANTHTHTHLTALFPGLPRWAGTRKVKPIWILLKQQTVSGSGISWAICKSAPCCRQITTPAPHHSVFYRSDALPAAQPTASEHWRHCWLHENGREMGIGVWNPFTVISSLFVFQFECWLYFQHSLQVLLLCMVAMQVFQYTFDLSYTAVRSSQTGPLSCCVLLLLFFYPR